MQRITTFIVKYKWVIMGLFLVVAIASACCIPLVKVEYSIQRYLPDDTDTKKALDIMEREFKTYGTATILVKDVEYGEAEALYLKIKVIDGVKSFDFGDTEEYYKDGNALFKITYNGEAGDEIASSAYADTIAALEGRDYAVPSTFVDSFADRLAKDMIVILGIAAVVIVLVLLFTSKSFAEIIAFPIVFGVAALLNMGTNWWFGTISFVSNSVCIILQLALAVDYSIILCHRFTAEKEACPGDAERAMAVALRKSIPEICGSCLTTIAGLLALVTMQLKLGADLGLVLAKSIVCSIITVLLLMPCVLLLLSKLMDKTRHRNFVPKISFWGKGAVKGRYAIPVVFLALVVCFGVFFGNIDYSYSKEIIASNRPSATQIAAKEKQDIFGYDTTLVVLLPSGDYEKEKEILTLVEGKEGVKSGLGLANIKINDSFSLTDKVTSADFAEFTGLSKLMSDALFSMYASANGDSPSNIDDYGVPVFDIANYAVEVAESGSLPLGDDVKETVARIKPLLIDAKEQLAGDNYSRLVFTLDVPVESEETFALIEEIMRDVKDAAPTAIFAGESVSAYDLRASFSVDNILINVLTVVFVFAILLFTFRSWGIPILLVSVIQGAIFINFGFASLVRDNVFFFVYLIVSAIQMGATIDYAILITNHYRELKGTCDKKTAIIETINQSFPTIITSGLMMITAAFLIGGIASDPLVASIGTFLGTGTIISILSVMTVLPALLYLFGGLIDKTAIRLPKFMKRKAKPAAESCSAAENAEQPKSEENASE